MTTTPDAPAAAPGTRGGVELTGLETIPENERRGRPAGLFWPWFAANVSVFGIAYGAYLLGFGISFWQAVLVGVIGIVVSFFLVGVVSLAGKRGSAPTMVLSRTMFGVHGARVVSILSWLLTVGWESVLCVNAVFAVTATADFFQKGAGDSVGINIVALLVVAAIIVVLGIFGFHWIMRAQLIITIVTGVVTLVFLVTVLPHIDLSRVGAIPAGSAAVVIGGLVFMMTGFGLGWVNAGADYSRYLPRSASGRGVVGWTTFGAAAAPVVLLVFGLLLAGSSKSLNTAIGAYSLGPLVTLTQPWFIIPFAIVVVLGLIAGAVMDVYSSGLALLSAGLRVPRPVAAGIDGVIMTLLSVYVIFFGGDFFGQFQGFLITLGVPIAVWAGIFIADVILRRRDVDEAALYSARGRYGAVNWLSIGLLVVGTVIGWGLVTNTYAAWLGWQGYLLFGLRESWGGANLGVLIALVIGFVGYLVGGRGAVRRQEA
ncbi:purine-cytosine permease family protein [Pseudolysinimonas sp.]|uniref:purine-cytosine permease family protein n=1 Tax=Pseudolysinimonas sp. TaxID=2680009 RepID=UPI003F801833